MYMCVTVLCICHLGVCVFVSVCVNVYVCLRTVSVFVCVSGDNQSYLHVVPDGNSILC